MAAWMDTQVWHSESAKEISGNGPRRPTKGSAKLNVPWQPVSSPAHRYFVAAWKDTHK